MTKQSDFSSNILKSRGSLTTMGQHGEDDCYTNLSYGRIELARVMREAYDQLIDFITRPAFQKTLNDLYDLDSHKRPSFVASVLLDEKELAKRDIQVPEGIMIQRSAFGDRRPTLFCVKKYLPDRYSDTWENVNITFDNSFPDDSVSRAPEYAWREPLPVNLQTEVMARGGDLEQISVRTASAGK
jgi:hypothetical protein